jgi:hypothetical protein
MFMMFSAVEEGQIVLKQTNRSFEDMGRSQVYSFVSQAQYQAAGLYPPYTAKL